MSTHPTFVSAATELVDELSPPHEDSRAARMSDGEQRTEDTLSSAVEALSCRMSPLELSRVLPQQLVHMHQQLGDMMRRLVTELQSRLCQDADKH